MKRDRRWLERLRARLAHPSPGRLMQWLDEELEAEATASVAAHVESCQRCRGLAAEMAGGLGLLPIGPGPAPAALLEDGRRRLQEALARRGPRAPRRGPAVRLAVELSPIFGEGLAEWLADLEAGASHAEVAFRAETLIASFLGRRSATRALDRFTP